MIKFSCKREDIVSAVSKAEKAVPPKSSLPVMEGILINALKDCIILTGNDLEIAIEAKFDADVAECGKIVLNCRMFSDIIRKTGGDTVNFETNEKNVAKITSGLSVFEISGINADEFPDPFDFEINSSIVMETSILKSMIRQTIFATSKSEFRQTLTGELFRVIDDTLNVVALDNHRIAIRKEKFIRNDGVTKFVVPFKTLNEFLKIAGDEGEVEIFPSKRFLMFEFGGCKLISRVIDGEYINYDKIIEVQSSTKVRADIRKMRDTFNRVQPIIFNEKVKSPVKLNLSGGIITIDCATLTGKVHDETNVDVLYGDDLEIGFTNQYLVDAFSACDDDEVFLEFSTPLSPLVITPLEGDKFLYVILPVRLRK